MDADEKPISILKEYPPVKFRSKPTREDLRRADRVELRFLRDEIRRLKDKIERLEFEIRYQVKMLTEVLNGEDKQTYESLKRRISQLEGSLEYRGRSDNPWHER